MSFEHWYLFPIAVTVSMVCMACGIGGSVIYSPLFILWLRLEPAVAIGTALFTQMFGMSSGLYAYVRSGRIDYRVGRSLLLFSVPGAIAGVLLADYVPAMLLKAVFAVALLGLGVQLLRSAWLDRAGHGDAEALPLDGEVTRLTDADGHELVYRTPPLTRARPFAAVGGMLLGMISVGLAELVETELVVRERMPPRVAIATSVFLMVVTVVVAVIGHASTFAMHADADAWSQVLSITMFTVPGVAIGGQLGPRLGGALDPEVLKLLLGVMFVLVAGLVLATSV